MSWIQDLFSNSAGEIINSITDGVDKFVTTDKERQELELQKEQAKLDLMKVGIEAEKMHLQDTQSARNMQVSTKSKTPSILTIIFTLAYFAITVFMLYFLLGKLDAELSQFVTVFISTIFGAFNAIMVQIISFYFGSSDGHETQGQAIADSFNRANSDKT